VVDFSVDKYTRDAAYAHGLILLSRTFARLFNIHELKADAVLLCAAGELADEQIVKP
jgi:hypothetical protein